MEQDGQTMSKEFTPEKRNYSDEDFCEENRQESNTDEKGIEAMQDYIVCLGEDLEINQAFSKSNCLIFQ